MRDGSRIALRVRDCLVGNVVLRAGAAIDDSLVVGQAKVGLRALKRTHLLGEGVEIGLGVDHDLDGLGRRLPVLSDRAHHKHIGAVDALRRRPGELPAHPVVHRRVGRVTMRPRVAAVHRELQCNRRLVPRSGVALERVRLARLHAQALGSAPDANIGLVVVARSILSGPAVVLPHIGVVLVHGNDVAELLAADGGAGAAHPQHAGETLVPLKWLAVDLVHEQRVLALEIADKHGVGVAVGGRRVDGVGVIGKATGLLDKPVEVDAGHDAVAQVGAARGVERALHGDSLGDTRGLLDEVGKRVVDLVVDQTRERDVPLVVNRGVSLAAVGLAPIAQVVAATVVPAVVEQIFLGNNVSLVPGEVALDILNRRDAAQKRMLRDIPHREAFAVFRHIVAARARCVLNILMDAMNERAEIVERGLVPLAHGMAVDAHLDADVDADVVGEVGVTIAARVEQSAQVVVAGVASAFVSLEVSAVVQRVLGRVGVGALGIVVG